MLSASRALSLNADSGRPLPRVDAFEKLYAREVTPRFGEVIMVAGRSGTQKSGFTLFWVDEMNLPTLYFSADMNAFTASSRIASKRTGYTLDEIERSMKIDGEGQRLIKEALSESNIDFSFGSPLTWWRIEQEIEGYVELHDAYPQVVVFDNLMDFENAESDYTEQMSVMSGITEFARDTGATCFVLHHASDKTWDAQKKPWMPPSRDQIKNGLAEKPELSLTVALDPHTMEYRVACVKQRNGPCDPSANSYVTLRCEPELTRFHKLNIGGPSKM